MRKRAELIHQRDTKSAKKRAARCPKTEDEPAAVALVKLSGNEGGPGAG